MTVESITLYTKPGADAKFPATSGKTTASTTAAAGIPFLNVLDYGAVMDGTTDDTAALTAAIAALPSTGGVIRIPGQTSALRLATAMTITKSGVTILGTGPASRILVDQTTTAAITISATTAVAFQDLRITHKGTGQVFAVDGSFRCSWIGVTVDGYHYADPNNPGASNTTQTGFRFYNNSGDNRIIDCDINNLGVGIQAEATTNYVMGGVIGTCDKGVLSAGTDGGMHLVGVTFTSTPGRVTNNVSIPVTSNAWYLQDIWAEGADTPIVVGSGANGPVMFSIRNSKLAGTTRNLDLVACGISIVDTVRFSVNPTTTPDPIRVNATNAISGYAIGLLNDQGTEIATSVFPNGWTYFPRFNSEAVMVAGRTVRAGTGLAAGQASYFESGGTRARFGYDGTNVVITTAGGGREVRIIAGASNTVGLRADNNGVAFNNTAPIAKPTVTGSRGSNAALQSLLTALANYGLITDSSS